jgi:hypothetical protein
MSEGIGEENNQSFPGTSKKRTSFNFEHFRALRGTFLPEPKSLSVFYAVKKTLIKGIFLFFELDCIRFLRG